MHLQIFDRDGMFLHKFSVPDLKASTLAVDANRRIIVADSANRCIHVISLDTGEAMFFVCLFVCLLIETKEVTEATTSICLLLATALN